MFILQTLICVSLLTMGIVLLVAGLNGFDKGE